MKKRFVLWLAYIAFVLSVVLLVMATIKLSIGGMVYGIILLIVSGVYILVVD